MPDRPPSTVLISVALGAALVLPLGARAHAAGTQDPSAPRVLLDQSPRAVEYQLSRLTNDELVLVERNDDEQRYRPVYLAILTRKGVPAQYRDEAVAALVKLDKSTPSSALLVALAKVPPDDALTAEKLLGLLFAQDADALRQERDTFARVVAAAPEPSVRTGAYGAMMIGDGKPDAAWQLALGQEGHLLDLLRGVPYLGRHDALRGQLFGPIRGLVSEAKDPATRAEAIGMLGWTRRDSATFELLAQEVIKGKDENARRAALRSLQVMPEDAWPAAGIEPLARAIVTQVGALPPGTRTEPAVLDEIQFGERLAARIGGDAAKAIRRDLRALGVHVVKIQTLPEKLSFDLRWFAVEAGKPVQIVLVNPDAMPHNLVLGQPGSLQEIGTAGGAMPMPTDPAATAKAFVPDSPLVLAATRLLKEGETDRLGFNAPREPGEYVFVCTFPGHWVRMYGVMLVVDNLEAWEAKPVVPLDPMTKQPFTSQRN